MKECKNCKSPIEPFIWGNWETWKHVNGLFNCFKSDERGIPLYAEPVGKYI